MRALTHLISVKTKKGSVHWQYYFYLYLYQKSLSQNNYKASKSAKDLKISLNQLKANESL